VKNWVIGTKLNSIEYNKLKNAPLSVNFVYACKNYPTSMKLTLCGAPFPSIEVNSFAFAPVYIQIAVWAYWSFLCSGNCKIEVNY
jgi:hypothetical protein